MSLKIDVQINHICPHDIPHSCTACVKNGLLILILKFHEEDVAGQYDKVLLIWEFDVDVLLSATSTPLAPKYPPGNDENHSICPLLDITSTSCNCSSFPLTGKVLIDLADFTVPETQIPHNFSPDLDEIEDQCDEVLEQSLPDLHLNETDNHNAEQEQNTYLEQDDEQENNDVEQFAELISMKGTTFHVHFQEALHACKQLMLEESTPEVSLTAEPVNKCDENAIVVKALLGIWKPIGYLPARKLPKVTDAMRKREITSVVLNNVIYKYINACKSHRYFAKILILKRNRWLPDSPKYEYNDPI